MQTKRASCRKIQRYRAITKAIAKDETQRFNWPLALAWKRTFKIAFVAIQLSLAQEKRMATTWYRNPIKQAPPVASQGFLNYFW